MYIWSLIETLEGRTLRTLDPTRSSPFTVETVTHRAVVLRTAASSKVSISQEKILECWDTLVEQQKVGLNIGMHVDLGLGRSASYVAAVLACIPDVIVHTKPIWLKYHETS